MSLSELRLTREGVCRTFGLSHEALEALESQGVLTPDVNHTFDLAGVAAALFHFGINEAAHAEQKLVTVATAIRDVLPALQRLSELPDRAMLDTWARERVAVELSAFFAAFSEMMARGSAALDGPPGEQS